MCAALAGVFMLSCGFVDKERVNDQALSYDYGTCYFQIETTIYIHGGSYSYVKEYWREADSQQECDALANTTALIESIAANALLKL